MLAVSNIAYGLTPAGINVTTDLKIGAVIHSEEKGEIEALWYKGGEDQTARGDKVVWGFFYANPQEVSWGNINNPEVYVKIWFDASGRVDVNFFHVSVPNIKVHSQYRSDVLRNENVATLQDRYVRHSYENGQGYSEVNKEDGIPSEGYKQESNPTGNDVASLKLGAIIKTVEKGNVEAVWKLGGQSTTSRGDVVIWGYFYANLNDVSWGSLNNPEIFVKIFVDAASIVTFVNFFHVSVPNIEVYSDFPRGGDYNLKGTTTVSDRYIRHEYQPVLFPYIKDGWSVYRDKDAATDDISCVLEAPSLNSTDGRSLFFRFERSTNYRILGNMIYMLSNKSYFSGFQMTDSLSLFRVDNNSAITLEAVNKEAGGFWSTTKKFPLKMSDSAFGGLLPQMKTGKILLIRGEPINFGYGYLEGTVSLSGFNDALDVFNLCVDGVE